MRDKERRQTKPRAPGRCCALTPPCSACTLQQCLAMCHACCSGCEPNSCSWTAGPPLAGLPASLAAGRACSRALPSSPGGLAAASWAVCCARRPARRPRVRCCSLLPGRHPAASLSPLAPPCVRAPVSCSLGRIERTCCK